MRQMQATTYAAIVCGLLTSSGVAWSQATASNESPREGAMPVTQLIAMAAKKSGKTFIVDPRVRGDVIIIGKDAASISYADFLSVLQVNGFTVSDDTKGYARILPDANARQQPTPLVTSNESYPDAQFVTRILRVKNVPATMLVPLLRPLLPQQAHLVAMPCTNTLIVVDTFGNVKRIENIVKQIDTGEAFTPEKCTDFSRREPPKAATPGA